MMLDDARCICEMIIRPPEPAIRFASTLLGSWHFPGGCKARGTWHTCSLGWRKLQVLGSCEKPSLGAAGRRHGRGEVRWSTVYAGWASDKTCCSRPERPATTCHTTLEAATGCFWQCPSVSYQFRVLTVPPTLWPCWIFSAGHLQASARAPNSWLRLCSQLAPRMLAPASGSVRLRQAPSDAIKLWTSR